MEILFTTIIRIYRLLSKLEFSVILFNVCYLHPLPTFHKSKSNLLDLGTSTEKRKKNGKGQNAFNGYQGRDLIIVDTLDNLTEEAQCILSAHSGAIVPDVTAWQALLVAPLDKVFTTPLIGWALNGKWMKTLLLAFKMLAPKSRYSIFRV